MRNRLFYATYILYIVAKFYTFVIFTKTEKTFKSGYMIKELNKLKSINQLSSI